MVKALKEYQEAISNLFKQLEAFPKDQAPQVAAMKKLKAYCDEMLICQPFLIKGLNLLLNACGDKKASPEVKSLASELVQEICQKISPNAVTEVIIIIIPMHPLLKFTLLSIIFMRYGFLPLVIHLSHFHAFSHFSNRSISTLLLPSRTN